MCSQFVTYVSTQRQLRSKIPLSFDSFSLFWAAMAASVHTRRLCDSKFKYVTSQSLSRWQKLEQLKHCFNKTVKGVMACDVSLEAMFFPFLVALLYTPATKSLLVATLVFFALFTLFFFSSVLSLLCTTDGLVLELKYSPFFKLFSTFQLWLRAARCSKQWWIGRQVWTLCSLLVSYQW